MPELTDANADLMAPIAAVLNGSEKDLPTKVGVLLDLAAALLATSPRMRRPSELRLTADEMRKRMIRAVRLHQTALDARQQDATAALEALARSGGAPMPPRDGQRDGAG